MIEEFIFIGHILSLNKALKRSNLIQDTQTARSQYFEAFLSLKDPEKLEFYFFRSNYFLLIKESSLELAVLAHSFY